MHLRRLSLFLFALLLASCSHKDSSPATASNSIAVWVESEYQKNLIRFAADADVRVVPGLVADRKHRYVDILATATGADAAIEAFIVTEGPDASRAIAVTTLKPAAIRAALEFIGLSAGHPQDEANQNYWPKGERVTATFSWDSSGSGQFDHSARAEELITDVNWSHPLPMVGLRFVGPSSGDPSEIATAYNAKTTVLEVPYLVDRNAIQGNLIPSEDYRFAVGEKLRIRLRPEFDASSRRVYDFMLQINAGTETGADQLQNLGVALTTPDGKAVVNGNFETVFVYLKDRVADGKEPFLQLQFADSLSAQSVRQTARFVQTFLIEQDIRIDPNDAHIFFSAFLPREAWRDPSRRGRASQPLEIHLESGFSGEIIQYRQPGERIDAPTKASFAGAKELEAAIKQGQPWQTDGVFLFVSPNAQYAQIRQVHKLTRSLFPNIYVFM